MLPGWSQRGRWQHQAGGGGVGWPAALRQLLHFMPCSQHLLLVACSWQRGFVWCVFISGFDQDITLHSNCCLPAILLVHVKHGARLTVAGNKMAAVIVIYRVVLLQVVCSSAGIACLLSQLSILCYHVTLCWRPAQLWLAAGIV